MPTLEEINAAAPDTPVFILHLLLTEPLLNRDGAAKPVGYTKDTPQSSKRAKSVTGTKAGNPTGTVGCSFRRHDSLCNVSRRDPNYHAGISI